MSHEAMNEDEYLSGEAIESLDLANCRESLKATAQALAGLAEMIQDDMTPEQARNIKPVLRVLAIDLGKTISQMSGMIRWNLIEDYVEDAEDMENYGFCLTPIKPQEVE